MSSGTRIENHTAHSERSVIAQQTSTRSIERVAGTNRVTGTTIGFGATNTITDSGNGLAVFAVNEIIEVRGSASNDGEYIVKESAAGSLTVAPGTVEEAAGASIELRRK